MWCGSVIGQFGDDYYCALSGYYNNYYPQEYASHDYFLLNSNYINHTVKELNVFCYNPEDFENDYCFDGKFDNNLNLEEMTDDEYLIYRLTIGCRECSSTSVPQLELSTYWGALVQVCMPKTDYDYGNEANVPCTKMGEIYQDVGILETDY